MNEETLAGVLAEDPVAAVVGDALDEALERSERRTARLRAPLTNRDPGDETDAPELALKRVH